VPLEKILSGRKPPVTGRRDHFSVLKPWGLRPQGGWHEGMDLRHRFATNLRRVRHEKGISQEALAYEAGVDRAHVSKIERAVTYVGLEIIGKFAKVLGVDPVEFFRVPPRRNRRS